MWVWDAIKVIQNVSLKLSKTPGTEGKIVQDEINDVLNKKHGNQTITQNVNC